MDVHMAASEIRVEKYIVKLTEAERIYLQALLIDNVFFYTRARARRKGS